MPTPQQLEEMQNWSLEMKIAHTQAKIIEWYLRYNGQIYVSFSGGKDSTVLLHIARQIYPDIKGVFVNTGLEYPDIVNFVSTFENVDMIRPERRFQQVIKEFGYPVISKEVAGAIYGYRRGWESYIEKFERKDFGTGKWKFLINAPFKISNKCCDIMKKDPIKLYEKETHTHGMVATMACESQQRRTDWLKSGCNAFDNKRPVSKPLSFWTEQDVLAYIDRYKLDIVSLYGEVKYNEETQQYYTTGCDRTGCFCCMFGIHLEGEPNRFQQMKITHPKLYRYCIETLKMGEILDFLHIKYD